MKKLLLAFGIALFGSFSLTATPVATVQAAMVEHAVTGVKAGEFLNMRAGAGVSNGIVGRIPADGRGVVPTGEERRVGNSTWAKIYWRGTGGWVNKHYLAPASQVPVVAAPPAPPAPPAAIQPRTSQPPAVKPPATSAPVTVLACSGNEPFWRIDIAESYVSVNLNDGPVYQVPVTFRQTSANNTRIAVVAGAEGPNNTQAFMEKVESCNDGMSDLKFPYSLTAVLNNRQVVSGCCRVLQQ